MFLSGYGTANFGGPASDALQKNNLKVVSISKCTTHYKTVKERDHICTVFQKSDTCQVDSGGPLVWTDPSTGKLAVIGVVSYGSACTESSPFVNAKVPVPMHLSWIKTVLTGI